jgi:TonB family protein
MLKAFTQFAAATVVIMSSAAFAVPKAPWKVPESDFGGARPLNRGEWYTFRDYPDAAIQRGEQGVVRIGFTIGTDGMMTECHVVRSSGYPDLDAIPCKVMKSRARFKPAVDAQGQPRTTTGYTFMMFWLPEQ